MRPSLVAEALHKAIKVKQSVFIWGGPGAGKSSVVHQVAKLNDMQVADLRLSTIDSPDLRGYPHIVMGRMCFAVPDFLPTDENSTGVLFLDEMNAGRPDVQAAAYQLVLDRKIGRYTLPPGWAVIAAGNRDSDQGVTYTMAAPLSNRFLHLDYEVNFQDWRAWARGSKLNLDVANFLNFRPDLLYQPDFDKHAFPTPRSWEFVSNVIDPTLSRDVERGMIAGAVGDGAAAEFAGFLKIARELPNPDSILVAPDKADVPKDLATLYALCGALANRASPANWGNLVKYADRLKPEFQSLLIRDSVARKIELAGTPEFSEWAEKNAALLV